MGPPGNRGSWGPCVLAHTQSTPKKAYKRKGGPEISSPPSSQHPDPSPQRKKDHSLQLQTRGRTDNSWGPRAIGDHGSPVSLPKLK
ncbi:unnamed protein product [Staurois parvus]|uniref:Uncharacterized protein n=1 Tax=Staurois parvus TaxID=386267 RepID=A0ABN9H0J5_9NEOB|nr:unnamed protein product [Staurois parvus]